MTTIKIARCLCGATPKVEVWRAAEDMMEARASCPSCGLQGEEIEHVWGGIEAMQDAADEWTRMIMLSRAGAA